MKVVWWSGLSPLNLRLPEGLGFELYIIVYIWTRPMCSEVLYLVDNLFKSPTISPGRIWEKKPRSHFCSSFSKWIAVTYFSSRKLRQRHDRRTFQDCLQCTQMSMTINSRIMLSEFYIATFINYRGARTFLMVYHPLTFCRFLLLSKCAALWYCPVRYRHWASQ